MTLGELIKRYRADNGKISQRKFAQMCEVSNGYISMIEAGANPRTGEPIIPTLPNIRKIANAMGMSVNTLMQMVDDMPVDISGKDAEALPANIVPASAMQMHAVPMIGEIAAGTPIVAEQIYETYVASPIHADFALTVKGDSMSPTYLNGDVVYLRQQDDVEDGQVAAVIIDDDATLKHVYHISNGLNLISDNPKYPPRVVTFDEFASIRIIGLVIGYTRMYD